ncbi:Exonuclease SbcC [Burkholderia vietnamiensis]|nr:Exonuclease SbcC [Burkholderia vietnamiensis]
MRAERLLLGGRGGIVLRALRDARHLLLDLRELFLQALDQLFQLLDRGILGRRRRRCARRLTAIGRRGADSGSGRAARRRRGPGGRRVGRRRGGRKRGLRGGRRLDLHCVGP